MLSSTKIAAFVAKILFFYKKNNSFREYIKDIVLIVQILYKPLSILHKTAYYTMEQNEKRRLAESFLHLEQRLQILRIFVQLNIQTPWSH